MKYASKNYPLQNINDNLYQVHAEYKIDKVKDVQGLKEYLECETVFKFKQTDTYLFCNKVSEAEIVE